MTGNTGSWSKDALVWRGKRKEEGKWGQTFFLLISCPKILKYSWYLQFHLGNAESWKELAATFITRKTGTKKTPNWQLFLTPWENWGHRTNIQSKIWGETGTCREKQSQAFVFFGQILPPNTLIEDLVEV